MKPTFDEVVEAAYSAIVFNRFGLERRFKLKGKTAARASALRTWCLEAGVSVRFILSRALEFFSSRWCLDTFNTPYPPLSVILSPKSLRRVIGEELLLSGRSQKPDVV